MAQRSATEVFTRYATTVETLSDAWVFVMEHVDRVGERPSVTISPLSSVDALSDEPERWEHYYEVSVSGTVESPTGEAGQ